jgi:hypothetical protein
MKLDTCLESQTTTGKIRSEELRDHNLDTLATSWQTPTPPTRHRTRSIGLGLIRSARYSRRTRAKVRSFFCLTHRGRGRHA